MRTIYTATSTFERIKRITSHGGLPRFIENNLIDTNLVIPRTDLPSPYDFGPTHMIYRLAQNPMPGTVNGDLVFIVETVHKTYDVFRVRPEVTPYPEVR